ncbi:hypothetical protein [Clostridium sp. UBA5119]|uniref:hypothetical protein n=1 Tax=Clostridium sp. UBA5119 TaxID=1946366 RepID=UPI003217DFA5
MNKISEKLDLSRKILDIDVESPIFDEMRGVLDKQIQKVIQLVYDGNFQSGEISLKLNLELPTHYKTIPEVDSETGEMVEREYKYKRPVFEHKLTTTLKKQFKDEGSYSNERDVQLIDGYFIAVPFKKNQISLFDNLNMEINQEA